MTPVFTLRRLQDELKIMNISQAVIDLQSCHQDWRQEVCRSYLSPKLDIRLDW